MKTSIPTSLNLSGCNMVISLKIANFSFTQTLWKEIGKRQKLYPFPELSLSCVSYISYIIFSNEFNIYNFGQTFLELPRFL